MMAPATSATRIFGLLAVLLLAAAQDSTTGGAPDAGPSTSSYTDCGGTKAPADPLGPGETPAPTLSFRCLPTSLLSSYTDTPPPVAADANATMAGTTSMDTPSPSEAMATPEPTVVADSTGVDADTTPSPSEAAAAGGADATEAGTVMATEAGAGDRDLDTTPSPTMLSTTAEEDDAAADPDAGEDAGAVPTTPAPTNEDGQTAGDSTDAAFGLAPRSSGAALAASCGLLLAAGILAL